MNELERRVLRLIGENPDNPDVFRDGSDAMAQIRTSINDAVQELCVLTGSYTRTYHLATLEDRQFYRIAPQRDQFAYVLEAWDRTHGRRLEQTDFLTAAARDPFFLRTRGAPLYYGQCGQHYVWITPYPSSKGLILELRCAMVPAPYERDDDPVKLRAAFRDAAVFLAVSEYHASRGDAQRAGEYLERYLEAANMMQLHPRYAERQYQMQTMPGGNRNAATV